MNYIMFIIITYTIIIMNIKLLFVRRYIYEGVFFAATRFCAVKSSKCLIKSLDNISFGISDTSIHEY